MAFSQTFKNIVSEQSQSGQGRPDSTSSGHNSKSLHSVDLRKCKIIINSLFTVNPDAMLGLKLRGLPFSAKENDILMFFKDYNVLPGCVKLGETEEKMKTGEGAALFSDE